MVERRRPPLKHTAGPERMRQVCVGVREAPPHRFSVSRRVTADGKRSAPPPHDREMKLESQQETSDSVHSGGVTHSHFLNKRHFCIGGVKQTSCSSCVGVGGTPS